LAARLDKQLARENAKRDNYLNIQGGKIMRKSFVTAGTLAVFFFAAFLVPSANAQSPYEVWACGDFNLQGYQDQPTIQFYPFNAKIGDLLKVDLENFVIVINPSPSGNYFAYLVFRIDGAPVYWFYFDSSFQVVNSKELFPSCMWNES
jgi:hypothetical protein